jgi:hypothetical protein
MGTHRGWTFRACIVFAFLLAAAGCGDGNGGGNKPPPANTMAINANLAAAQVVGGSTETGTAAADLTLNLDDGALSGAVTLSGLTATGVTINTGFAGERGPAIVTLTQDNSTRWTVPPNAVLTAADQEALASGAIHVLVTTAAQPNGAVRAQLITNSDVSLQFVHLTDTQEVPLLTSAATAVAAITLDRSSGAVVVHVNTVGLADAVAAHVHRALAGMNGAILIGLNQDPNDVNHWSSDGAVLDATGLQAFDAAELYINVHTPAHQGGEIRGQIVPSDRAVLFVKLSGAGEVPPVATTARATAAITFNPTFPTGALAVHLNTSELDDAVAAHVHQAPVGANGPVLIGLNQDANDPKHWQSDAAVLDAAGIQAFNAGDLYVNVHTPDNQNGEVRGQIVPENAPPPSSGSFVVASISPAAGANLTSFPSQIVVTFNRPVLASSVAASSVTLTASGGDGNFSSGNEMGLNPTAISASGSTATIDLSGLTVADDTFEARLKGTGASVITDLNGSVLDGNSDNTSGGDFVSVFSVATPSSAATFEFVQNNIFTPSCALSGCHAGPSPQQGMNLSAGQAYAALVNVPSTEQPSLLRVRPGNPDQSYLVQKIMGTAAVGARMPLGGAPLSDSQIQAVRDWIAAGALNPGTQVPPAPPGY